MLIDWKQSNTYFNICKFMSGKHVIIDKIPAHLGYISLRVHMTSPSSQRGFQFNSRINEKSFFKRFANGSDFTNWKYFSRGKFESKFNYWSLIAFGWWLFICSIIIIFFLYLFAKDNTIYYVNLFFFFFYNDILCDHPLHA